MQCNTMQFLGCRFRARWVRVLRWTDDQLPVVPLCRATRAELLGHPTPFSPCLMWSVSTSTNLA
uniref:Uncharacterized protein n=1 Tax=Physcomitrium patens TaxID=3218 RepID=A0A2K1JQ75_PHYPA|nr:hypothetical protein PHYPA_016076 [Physcomitrium patens]